MSISERTDPAAARQQIGWAANAIASAAAHNGMTISRRQIGPVDAMVCRGHKAGTFTRVHQVLFVVALGSGWANRQLLDGYLKAALRYAIDNKTGMPRGVQSGVAAFAVAVTDQLAPDAADWADRQRNGWAAMGYPVAVELATGKVSQPHNSVFGLAYARMRRRFVEEHVESVLQRAAAYG